MIEGPEQTVAIRTELVEIQMIVDVGFRSRVEAPDHPEQVALQPCGVGLAKIDGDLRKRQRLPLSAGRPAQHHRVTEVGLVLNPVQVDAQGRGHPSIEDAGLDARHQRSCNQARHLALWRSLASPGLFALRNVIDMNDHRTGRLSYVNPETLAAIPDANQPHSLLHDEPEVIRCAKRFAHSGDLGKAVGGARWWAISGSSALRA